MFHRLTNHQIINESDDHISCSDPHQISVTFSKIYIYNLDVNCPLQKFWFFLKETKIIEKKLKSVDVVLSNSRSDKKFIEYIDNLDEKIYRILNKKFNLTVGIKKSYFKKDFFPHRFNFSINCAQIFDDYNKPLEYNSIKFTDDITESILVELSDILISENDYWINYSIKQMKIKKDVFNEPIFDLLSDCHSDDNTCSFGKRIGCSKNINSHFNTSCKHENEHDREREHEREHEHEREFNHKRNEFVNINKKINMNINNTFNNSNKNIPNFKRNDIVSKIKSKFEPRNDDPNFINGINAKKIMFTICRFY